MTLNFASFFFIVLISLFEQPSAHITAQGILKRNMTSALPRLAAWLSLLGLARQTGGAYVFQVRKVRKLFSLHFPRHEKKDDPPGSAGVRTPPTK